jgi:hypothetical protein
MLYLESWNAQGASPAKGQRDDSLSDSRFYPDGGVCDKEQQSATFEDAVVALTSEEDDVSNLRWRSGLSRSIKQDLVRR